MPSPSTTERLSLTVSPIGPWLLVAMAVAVVVALTLWPYWRRLKESQDRRKYVVVGLRMVAVLMCFLAMLRPSLLVMQKVKQQAVILFLTDDSASMRITDEVNDSSRWDLARRVEEESQKILKKSSPTLDVKSYRFSNDLRPDLPGDKGGPEGRETALGAALLEAVKREAGSRLAAIVLLSDGASNSAIAPETAAQDLRSQGVPVLAVPFGSAAAGESSRDIAVTGLRTAEAVFVKNDLEVRGTLRVRGFPAGQDLEVELMAEGQAVPVSRATVKVPPSGDLVNVDGLRYIPQTAGETLLTLRVTPKEGELIPSNNEFSSFVTVLAGGLNVLHLQGPSTAWEGKYVTRSLNKAREIQSQLKVLLRPARGEAVNRLDADFEPGKYDVYVLGDVPIDYLTAKQQNQLALAVQSGAGLVMLGGRDSFGDGGWGRSPLAQVLPTTMKQGDGQIEPAGGMKMVPNFQGLDSYVLQIGSTPQESAALWQTLPNIPGSSRLGAPKPAAIVLAETPQREPLLVTQDDVGRGRVLVFGGETWHWFRGDDAARLAHQRFWRQVILWAARKEDSSESRVELKLDRRRVANGQTLEATAVARDVRDQVVKDAKFTTTVTATGGKPESMELFNQGDSARGNYYASGEPGVYTVSTIATSDGKEIGRASSRFLVYRDDRELENPAANISVMQEIARITGGEFLQPEALGDHFGKLDQDAYTQIESQVEYRLWDNWPFLLGFVGVLGAEWWVRKRMGWV